MPYMDGMGMLLDFCFSFLIAGCFYLEVWNVAKNEVTVEYFTASAQIQIKDIVLVLHRWNI